MIKCNLYIPKYLIKSFTFKIFKMKMKIRQILLKINILRKNKYRILKIKMNLHKYENRLIEKTLNFYNGYKNEKVKFNNL